MIPAALWRLAPWLLALAALVALVVMLIGWGREIENTRREAETGAAYIEGRQDVDDATGALPDDDARVLEWLRRFGRTD